MLRKRNLHRDVIERFTERTRLEAGEQRLLMNEDAQAQHHLKRFLNTVKARKRQLIEKMLTIEE